MPTQPLTEAEARFDIPVELHILEKANRVPRASIRRVGDSLFELTCPKRLGEGQRLLLTHEGRRIVVEVTAAPQRNGDVYTFTVKLVDDKYSEVRADSRVPVSLPATLRIAGEAESIGVRVADMSSAGMGIELPKALPLGARVCVNLERGLAFGEVRFCLEKAGRYFIGFRIEEYIS